MESSMEIPQNAKDRTAIYDPVLPLLDICSSNLSGYNRYTDVHHSTIHNKQALEIT
jgi:hypothetical protein